MPPDPPTLLRDSTPHSFPPKPKILDRTLMTVSVLSDIDWLCVYRPTCGIICNMYCYKYRENRPFTSLGELAMLANKMMGTLLTNWDTMIFRTPQLIRTLQYSGHLINQDTTIFRTPQLIRTLQYSGHFTNQDTTIFRTPH